MLYRAKDKQHSSLLQLKSRVHKSIYTVVSPPHQRLTQRNNATVLDRACTNCSVFLCLYSRLESPESRLPSRSSCSVRGGDEAHSESPRDNLENRKRLWMAAKKSLSVTVAPAGVKPLNRIGFETQAGVSLCRLCVCLNTFI